jgi:hypothetical protein
MSDYEYDKGLHSNQSKSNFQDGSQEWAGAQAGEMMRARQAEWDRQRAEQIRGDTSARGATTSARVATGSGEAGGVVVALEGGILSCVALYRNWPQYISLYSSFPRLSVLWEYVVAAGLVLLGAIFYTRSCRTSKLLAWWSFICVGAILAAWSHPWGLNWQTCLAGFLVVMMFLDRRALRS